MVFIIADEGKYSCISKYRKYKSSCLNQTSKVIPTYLYIGKNVDSNVLSRVESVNLAAKEYFSLNEKLDDFQKQFNELFLAQLLMMFRLFGLEVLKLIEPIMEIISIQKKLLKMIFSKNKGLRKE